MAMFQSAGSAGCAKYFPTNLPQPNGTMVTVHRRESTIAERVQALTLYANGVKFPTIEALTGLKRTTFNRPHSIAY
ncbi:hypothetical protein B0T26DRAFT_768055 [Lasiosphaeria miniovina]|uniref:Uncharacterized protein n=1 Tax=Lasiosphaeria miniovina TaxID=1954250 RepID=A0AA40E515_9PEZI|nr:uncharacterized protein B0T26DRAFT_768055 [Lasiosphaeria miniovina]KAK0728464.1 hypothetical protein B0T26DRAFT_768055 [Lasiosphaeria miniovina]